MAIQQIEVKKFIKDFYDKNEIDLEIEVPKIFPKLTAKTFVNRVNDIVDLEIKSRNPTYRDDAELSDYQNEQIYNAKIEQALYMLNVDDYTLITGYNPITNSIVSTKEISDRAFSPLARKILLASGMFYCGFRSKSNTYADISRFWRV